MLSFNECGHFYFAFGTQLGTFLPPLVFSPICLYPFQQGDDLLRALFLFGMMRLFSQTLKMMVPIMVDDIGIKVF